MIPNLCRYSMVAAVTLELLAGCSRTEPAKPFAKGDPLPTVSSKAGGRLVQVPGGSFTMGDAGGRADETPHLVSISAFMIDQVPVTQELYAKVMGVNPAKRKQLDCPVERTQWTDAVRFCNKCSELDGFTPCYNLDTWECNLAANGYRLPTEAEWEYACRAGSTGKFCFGDDESKLPTYAWLKPGSEGKTHPVGQKWPNAWDLFDMHGNVWQWCNDWYGENYYQESPKENPRGPADGKMRVLRGGAWDSTADKCRAAYRHKEFPTYTDACFGADSYGFRRVRSATAATVKPQDKRSVPGGAAPVAKSQGEKPVAPAPGKLSAANLKGTIIFTSDRSGSMKIWSMHASGKNPKQLTKSEGPDADPRFSPDGKRILYTTLKAGFPEIWLMNRDGSEPKFVTKGSQGSWSPKGDAIVFINDNQTFIRDLTAGTERLLTPKSWERCGVPAFSPDGQRVAVASRHLGDIGIFLVDLDGKQSQLKTEEACCTPVWSKDGKRMLYQTVNGHIHEVGLDGKGADQLTFGADVQHDARYSPDGKTIIFCRAPTPDGPWQICVQKVGGDEDEFVVLTKDGSNLLPDWHQDE